MGLVHAMAHCLDCNWQADSLNSMVLGTRHHKLTGHQLMVEQCFSKTYLRTMPNPKFKEIKHSTEKDRSLI